MDISGRLAVLTTSLLLIMGAGTIVGAVPAQASISTLCIGYAGCAKVGMSEGGYAAASKTSWWRMYAGHNCTNYAAYRMIRAGHSSVRPWTGSGNATNWGAALSRLTNSTPTVGAVAWWKAGVRPAGKSGHVAYVERVVSADEIIISQDSWGGDFSWARITRTGTGWPSGFVHFANAPVQPRVLSSSVSPQVRGPAHLGETLSATTGVWSPTPERFTYQWLVGGVPTPRATGPTLAVDGGMLGRRVSVTVTAARGGYPSVARTSAPTSPVAHGSLALASTPAVRGRTSPGHSLTLSTPGLASGARLGVQWLRAGRPVSGATGVHHRLTAADLGTQLSARVTVSKRGYADYTTRSAPSAHVRANPSLQVSSAAGRRRVAIQATVTAQGVRPVGGIVQVRRGKRLVGQALLQGGIARLTVTHVPRGKRTFRISYVSTSKVAATYVKRRVRVY